MIASCYFWYNGTGGVWLNLCEKKTLVAATCYLCDATPRFSKSISEQK